MSSEQDKDLVDLDLVAKKMHVACCKLFCWFDYSHIHIIYIYVFCHTSVLETCYNFLGKV